MHHRSLNILTVGLCLLLTVSSLVSGNDAAMRGDYEGVGNFAAVVPVADVATSRWTGASQEDSLPSCLPFYSEPHFILRVNDTGPYEYEPLLTSADLNGDGLEDVVITKMTFRTTETYELDILLNDGSGSLVLATSNVFSGTVPAVQHPTEVIVADLNGDDRSDIFVADHGYDVAPHPGYQNQLVLTAPNGRLVDATNHLPQQNDFTHSACAADIDGDDDIDLYVGNIWGQNDINP